MMQGPKTNIKMAQQMKRLKILLLVITLSILFGYFIYDQISCQESGKTDSSAENIASKKGSVPVVLTPVSMRDFEDRIVVQGNLEAKNVAMVHARVAATIESIFVDEGDPAVAGKTKLFQIDSLKLQKAVEVSRQSLEVAKCALNEKKANLERVDADLHKAVIDYERYKKLIKDKIVSNDEFERIESRYKQTMALHKHAQTLVNLSEEQQRQTEAALAIAEKDLRDALVYAPISGKVSKRFQEPGEMGDTKKPVLRIEDISIIEVSAFLPAQYYSLIQPGETKTRISVYGANLKEQIISYKSPTAHSKLRTFEIKCVLKDPPDGIFPGAMAKLEILLQQRKGLGVPKAAVIERGGQSVIFTIENGAAHMVKVKIGLETDGWIELMEKALPENTPVVTMGQLLLNEGTNVIFEKERP